MSFPLLSTLLQTKTPQQAAGCPSGFDAYFLSVFAERLFADTREAVIFVARDDARLASMRAGLRFFAPELAMLTLPAWDCLPYDRASPSPDILAKRMDSLFKLAHFKNSEPFVFITSISALLQYMPARDFLRKNSLRLTPKAEIDREEIIHFLSNNGFHRSSQVMEAGEFAVRGSLIDFYPSGARAPIRIDFFGDEIDSLRFFDPNDQRSQQDLSDFMLKPASEISLSDAARAQFQKNYIRNFGPVTNHDPLYEAVKEGRKSQGMEHWLPFFHEKLETIFDFLPQSRLIMDHQTDAAADARFKAIEDYYSARHEALKQAKNTLKSLKNKNDPSAPSAAFYKPVPTDRLYLNEKDWQAIKAHFKALELAPHQAAIGQKSINLGAKIGRNFAPERQIRDHNIYDTVVAHAQALKAAGKRVVFACYSEGSRERLKSLLDDHGLQPIAKFDNFVSLRQSPIDHYAMALLPLEDGFETQDMAFITEQDILGDRLVRPVRRQRRADNFLREASSLSAGDLVVHSSHGIGRFERIETLDVMKARHDCLLICYSGGDKLYVPVENIEVLSRYGNEADEAALDKLGGAAWQARKARMKERLKEMADALLKLAAERALRRGEIIEAEHGLYDEFAARFPYNETDDQERAIQDVMNDLKSGQPMDRLICGDVGFGKTEIALRAAFTTCMAGYQVAVIAPTTLLARQHHATFTKRFEGLAVRIGQLSRLVSAKDLKNHKAALSDGQLDIVIGTHALLAKDVHFKNLGLLIVDEEQHFGVAHKERLKALKANVHVLTLSATPIPRTLQMALVGLRELSIMATPPVDRLAVRTYALPFDPVVLREALLREHYRGGQSFYVVPRLSDLDEVAYFLREHVPEVKFAIGHGQMTPSALEGVISAFYDGQYDILLSTNIVESGIDIPSANTLIVHRADRFGLAQLYQLRGRVGRSKTRAYAYLTVPANRILTEKADKRLHILQSLDMLGAGFSIASHDMDIRGAGNLLGDEQSGHIREVGVELYQKMLEDAISRAKSGASAEADAASDDWSPTLNLGASVMIPESYVSDMDQRMALYRRLADLKTRRDVDAFLAELIDRFGPLPSEVKQLGAVMTIKGYARRAGIERFEAGPKGLVLHFKDKRFANPAGLIDFISRNASEAKVRPDHSLIYFGHFAKIGDRLKAAAFIARRLAEIAEGKEKAS